MFAAGQSEYTLPLAYQALRALPDRAELTANFTGTPSGSCFVQISDENVHLVRCVMDEVFGSENFIALIPFRKKTMPLGANYLEQMNDFLIWYGREREVIKYEQLFNKLDVQGDFHWQWYDLPDGARHKMKMSKEQLDNHALLPDGARVFRLVSMWPPTFSQTNVFKVEFDGKLWPPAPDACYPSNPEGMKKLVAANRLMVEGKYLRYVYFLNDYDLSKLTATWVDTIGARGAEYVVQTATEVIKRCLLMTTDPGDLVLDPTCGSGTTAHVAETWGRRWITIDTSHIALNIAKTRLMTASYPWYVLEDEKKGLRREQWDVRHGFDYKKVQRITLGSLANDEPPEEVTLYDQPAVDRKKLRVAGPFTVETLQNFDPLAPEAVDEASLDHEQLESFQARVFEHLKTAGVKNGARNETAVFARVDALADSILHAEGYYDTPQGERKAYIHQGPQFAPVSKPAVNEAVKRCRLNGDADWLLIFGFAFESDVENSTQTQKAGHFEVTKVRMHDDQLQTGLTKKDKKAASFVTIGEPDIAVDRESWIVDREGRRVANVAVVEKLSRIDGLAGCDGLDRDRLRFYALAAGRREVWVGVADVSGGGLGAGQHRGGAGAMDPGGIYPGSWDREGFIGGIGDFDTFVRSLGFPNDSSLRDARRAMRTHPQTAAWLTAIATNEPLTTIHESRSMAWTSTTPSRT